MSLIGIHGASGAGKDTFGEFFTRAGYRRISFAHPLKEAVAVIAGEPSHLYFTAEGKAGFSPVLGKVRRDALQNIGNGVREILDESVWIRRAIDAWDRSGRIDTVITDVRYPNEAEAIRGMGGIVIHLIRPNHQGLTGAAAAHVSEQPLPAHLVDIEITNDGTLGELHDEARKVLELLAPRGRAEV